LAVILALLVLLLAACDGLITFKVLTRYGIEAELNGIIRWASTIMPLGWAISFGIAFPTVIWFALAYVFHAPILLALLVAARAGFLVKQIETHRP
jgi:hypothetical protein